MPKNAGQKQKLLHLAGFFCRETDFDSSTGKFHGLTVSMMIEKLAALGISVERKTIYSDLKDLSLLGLDIGSTKKGRQTYYYVQTLPFGFELSEIKILIDSVQSAKFISERQSNIIIDKLEKLCSKHQRAELHHNVCLSGRVKTMNSSSIYAVDAINHAINEKRRISFDYYKWTLKDEALQKKNKEYVVDPIALVWEDENYYLIAYSGHEENPLRHYRVDKMKAVTVREESIGCGDFLSDFNLNEYIQSVFGMFAGSREELVTLSAPNELIGVFRDRFTDLYILRTTETNFEARVPVRVSDQFYGWLFGLGKGVRILEPESVRLAYAEKLKEAFELQGE